MTKTRVLIVDDSAVMRQLLTEIFQSDPQLEVVGVATDPYAAWDKIKRLRPDVVTLDVEMPRMDGLTFLEKMMKAHPLPVVMISSLTEKGCQTTLRALELGAIDFVTKPSIDVRSGTAKMADEICLKIRGAKHAKVRPQRSGLAASCPTPQPSSMIRLTHSVIAIGASTGGTEAICEILTRFPADAPGVVIVQHMPTGFTKSFADRLDRLCRIRVKEAKNGDRILPGHALLAPGDFHMGVVRSGANFSVKVSQGPPVNRFRPSVDVLFHSCAKALGSNVVGAILTGMGRDGAQGLLAMRNAGARTIAQDEATCIVFGMPQEAIVVGAAQQVLPLDRIAESLVYGSARPIGSCGS